jgi:diguanylate cyclase (GGDEF)-like protein/hemerythrin-like metal-binding protein/PAS domain S-box-containing protein
MAAIFWNDHFKLGLPEIDAQHAHLVELVNELSDAIADAGQLPLAGTLIEALGAYAAEHFRCEETVMAASGLPADVQARHRREHEGFIAKVDGIRRRGPLHQVAFAEQVLEFLTAWLISHILGSDRQVSEAVLGGTRAAAQRDDSLAVSPVARVLLNALGEAEHRFRLISDCAPAPMWVCDRQGRRGYYNRAWIQLAGPGAEAADFDHLRGVVAEDRDRYQATLDQLLATRAGADVEYRVATPGGEVWLLERVRPRSDGAGAFTGLIASAVDVSAMKRSEAMLAEINRTLEAEVQRRTAELEALSMTDPLTGLDNRRALTRVLEGELRRCEMSGRPLTLLFLDMDHFKRVNDDFGHAVGDRLLVAVGRALKARLREVDRVARMGGEEFVVLLVETPLGDGVAVAEDLRATIAGLRLPEMPGRTISISAGVTEWLPGDDADRLLQRADRALYHAKAAGRDRICRVGRAA